MPATTKTNAPKKPQDRKVKGAAWKKGKFHDLDLPSGETCQVRRPGVQGLIRAGVLQSLDQLTAIVSTETIPKAEGRPQINPAEVVKNIDPAKLNEMMQIIDDVTIYCVRDPEVLPAPLPDPANAEDRSEDTVYESDRSDELLYVDEIPEEDKMFIMQFAMGASADLERFRAESAAALGSAHAG